MCRRCRCRLIVGLAGVVRDGGAARGTLGNGYRLRGDVRHDRRSVMAVTVVRIRIRVSDIGFRGTTPAVDALGHLADLASDARVDDRAHGPATEVPAQLREQVHERGVHVDEDVLLARQFGQTLGPDVGPSRMAVRIDAAAGEERRDRDRISAEDAARVAAAAAGAAAAGGARSGLAPLGHLHDAGGHAGEDVQDVLIGPRGPTLVTAGPGDEGVSAHATARARVLEPEDERDGVAGPVVAEEERPRVGAGQLLAAEGPDA